MARENRNAEIEKRLKDIEANIDGIVCRAVEVVSCCGGAVEEREAEINRLQSNFSRDQKVIERLISTTNDRELTIKGLYAEAEERGKKIAEVEAASEIAQRGLCDRYNGIAEELEKKIASLKLQLAEQLATVNEMHVLSMRQDSLVIDLRHTLAERERQLAARLCELNELKLELCDRDELIVRSRSFWAMGFLLRPLVRFFSEVD